MFSTITDIKFDDYASAIPAYLCVIAMPLFYSISEGIAIGIISYTVLHLASGKKNSVNIMMYILSVLFILKYIFL
ncbi:MAG: NCS2 family permease, partial [Ruminococcus sp.]|nr:NCS2 family permease [Ruminococcus sp.]